MEHCEKKNASFDNSLKMLQKRLLVTFKKCCEKVISNIKKMS